MPGWVSHFDRLIPALALALMAVPARAAEPDFRPDVAPLSDFPDASRATRREGLFLPPGMPRLLAPGMTKRQVYGLLGAPHFHEALFGERRWNYILNFYTGAGTAYRICRLQLRWDRRMRLEAVRWSDDGCRELVYPVPAAPAPESVSVAPPAAAPSPVLSLYFDFDKAELREEARRDLAAFVRGGGASRLSVTGFTDGAGPEAYNDRLSLMRADAVAGALVAMGVPLSDLQISGAGERSPAHRREGGADPLNRRVVVGRLD